MAVVHDEVRTKKSWKCLQIWILLVEKVLSVLFRVFDDDWLPEYHAEGNWAFRVGVYLLLDVFVR